MMLDAGGEFRLPRQQQRIHPLGEFEQWLGGEFLEAAGQEVVQKHVGDNAGVLAVAGRPQALGAAPHHRVQVGEGVDGPVQTDAFLHRGRVAFQLLAGHRVGNEVAHQPVGVARVGRRAGQENVSQEIHRRREQRQSTTLT
jgi:hypothetical protein